MKAIWQRTGCPISVLVQVPALSRKRTEAGRSRAGRRRRIRVGAGALGVKGAFWTPEFLRSARENQTWAGWGSDGWRPEADVIGRAGGWRPGR